jgi:hypothetical protein
MPSYRSFTATIHDTTTLLPLREYMTSHNPLTNTCQTYIESSHNQPFTIVLKDEDSVFAQGTAVFVDGVYVDNGLTGPGIAVERRWYGKRVDHVFVKPFVFRENLSSKSPFSREFGIEFCIGGRGDQRICFLNQMLR